MAGLIVEVIDGRLSPLAQGLMQTGSTACGCSAGGDYSFRRSGGVLPPSTRRSFLFLDIGPLLATALHEHPRLREMNDAVSDRKPCAPR